MIMAGDAADAVTVAERVRSAFETCGATVAGNAIGATVSIGIASSADPVNLDTLLARGDAALYRAKAAGRNCIQIATNAPVVVAPPLAPLSSLAAELEQATRPTTPRPARFAPAIARAA